MISQLSETKSFIDKQEERIGKIVGKKVVEKLENKLMQYEIVAKNFKKYFNSDELFRVLRETVN